jgi:hypothetical protein
MTTLSTNRPATSSAARTPAADPGRPPEDTELASLEILHEHPTWFGPLFTELERRGLPFRARTPGDLNFPVGSPAEEEVLANGKRVVFNRMSPSAYLRDGTSAVRPTLHYLEELEARGVRVVNGSRAYATEISKLHQIRTISRLGLRAPATFAAHTATGAKAAAAELGFPLILKPNVGGSGAGVVLVASEGELDQALEALFRESGALAVDSTLLVQEYAPPADDTIVRVEVVGGRFLYAIRIHLTGETFNLCPADICRSTDGEELVRTACPTDTPRSGLRVEAHAPPAEAIREVEVIAAYAGIEVGGVEYLTHARTGERVHYDVNALSNFVADPLRVLGFDPTERLVDWLEEVLP